MQIEIDEKYLITLVLVLIPTQICLTYLYFEEKRKNKKLKKIIQNYEKDEDSVNQSSKNLIGNFKGEGHEKNKLDVQLNTGNESSDNIGNFYGKNHIGNTVKAEINKGNGNIINKGTLVDKTSKISNISDSLIKDLTMNMK